MDNINPVSEAATESNKAKILLFVKTSPMNSGQITSKEKDQPWASSPLRRTMIVGGGVLILTNITLIILASLKVLGILNYLS